MFIVETNLGILNTEAPGMKIEQSIQYFKKGAGVIIGKIGQNAFVSEQDFAYQEILSIGNCSSGVTKLYFNLYYEGSGGYNDVFTEKVVKCANQKENPFKLELSLVKLFGFASGQLLS